MHHRVWAEISLGTLQQNFRCLQRIAGTEATVAAVIKADAYGHGLLPCAEALTRSGATHLAVATLDEAQRLRDAGLTAPTIFTLPPLLPDEATECARLGLVPFVSSPEFHAALPQNGRCVLVIDTGMGREGMTTDEARACLDPRVIGLATHFSSADEPDFAPTDEQAARFFAFVESLGDRTAHWLLSLDNSPALLRQSHGKLVRPGAALFGIEPSVGALTGTGIEPVLSLRARITLVKQLPAGATVGYGRTHTLTRESIVATLPIGYGDGWLRTLSNRGVVLVNGQRCSILGRISMDQCQIDVTDAGAVRLGDVATLIGRDGDAQLTALEVAALAQTTCHEITTQLSARVPRVYRD